MNGQRVGNFAANESPSNVYSNYRMTYESPIVYKKESVGVQSQQRPIGDTKLLEKINYMIHLLEEQQLEKTNNITEEFILYTFLGVFIIFIVDSFSRAGKYTR
jgi:hypothetical protein